MEELVRVTGVVEQIRTRPEQYFSFNGVISDARLLAWLVYEVGVLVHACDVKKVGAFWVVHSTEDWFQLRPKEQDADYFNVGRGLPEAGVNMMGCGPVLRAFANVLGTAVDGHITWAVGADTVMLEGLLFAGREMKGRCVFFSCETLVL